MIFSSDICSFSRFFITIAPIYRAEKRSKKKRGTKITENILIINNLKLFLSKIEKAKTSLVPIKTQSADYEICEESASESTPPCFFLILMRQIGKQIRIRYDFVHYFLHVVG